MTVEPLKKWNQLNMELKRVGKGLHEDKKLTKQASEIGLILRRHADEVGECENSKTALVSEGKGLHRMTKSLIFEVDLVLKKLLKKYKELDAKNKESNAKYVKRANEEKKRHQKELKKDPTAQQEEIEGRTYEEKMVGVDVRMFVKAIKILDAYRKLPSMKNGLQMGSGKNTIAEAHIQWEKSVRRPVGYLESKGLSALVINGNNVEKYFKKLEGMSGPTYKLAKEVESHRKSLHKLNVEFQNKGGPMKKNVTSWAKKKKKDAHRQMQAKIVTGVIDDIGKDLRRAEVAAEL